MSQILITRGGISPEVFADLPLTLGPEYYPNGRWSHAHENYNAWWYYYRGYVLNERTNPDDPKSPFKYPARLNVVRAAVMTHAASTLGLYEDQIIKHGIDLELGIDSAIAEKTSKELNLLWKVNNGDVNLIEQILYQQIFGGCVIKQAWQANRKKWQTRLFNIDPRSFFPVWDGSDLNRLVSVDVQYQIPAPTSEARFGVKLDPSGFKTTPEYLTVNEHWDENEFEVTINGSVATWPDGNPMAGKNTFIDPILGHPIIPFTYIPRFRDGDFFGTSLVSGLMGAQDEFNQNVADLHESISNQSRWLLWVRNRVNGIKGLSLKRNEIQNLGMQQIGINNPPEMGAVEGPSVAEAEIEYIAEQYPKMFRELSGMPNVSLGSQDASVKSALALQVLLKPLLDLARMYRFHLKRGIADAMHKAFVISYTNGEFSNQEIDEPMIEAVFLGHRSHMPEVAPSDRAEKVSEVVQRMAAGLISPEKALEMLDGTEGIEEHLKQISEHTQELQKAEIQVAQAARPPQAGGSNNSKPSDRTTKAQAEGGRKGDK